MGFPASALLGLLISVTPGFAPAATTLDGAEIYSNETVRFGRWEIRMQVAATPGSISTFFTYHNNSYLGLPEPWREIDIEILGKDGKGFQSNLLTGHAAQRVTTEAFHATAEDLSKGFHSYVLDWTPDSVVWRLDGRTVRRALGSDPQVKDLADLPQTYRMNLWATTVAAWAGALDTGRLPVVQAVNWMAYSAYTPGQGPAGSDFTPKWTDDFTTFNTTRWARANWTFESNMADFTPNNVRVANGYLMLILSRKGWTGSVSPPADPVGNAYTVSLAPRAIAPAFRMAAFDGRLRVFAGESPGLIQIADSDGRIVARRIGSGLLEFEGLPRGVLHVHRKER